jgi:hypothetical protein
VNEVGLLPQLPLLAVRVEPSRAVPLMAGAVVFCGAADERADAPAVTTPTAASTAAAGTRARALILRKGRVFIACSFHGVHQKASPE